MALSADSKIKVLLKNEEAKAVLQSFIPDFGEGAQMKMVQGLTFRKLMEFPESQESGVTPEIVEEIDVKLREIAE